MSACRVAAVWLSAGLILAIAATCRAQESRGIYLPTFTFASSSEATVKSRIDAAISKAVQYKFNALYIQVRTRGDAQYFPNRNSTLYPNPEPRGEAYSIPNGFDPLQYAIDRGREAGVKIIAWMVTYPTWLRSTPPSSPDHPFNAHPTWITQDSAGNYATYVDGEYASLDPGIPAVQDYLANIYLDVVRNYDVDGIHFDYFRLPEKDRAGGWSKYGFNTQSLAQFTADTGFVYNPASDTGLVGECYEQWMREQVDNLAKRVWEGTKREKPWVEVSSFIVNFDDSPSVLAQSYNMWTNRGHFDYIVGGSYTDTNSSGIVDQTFVNSYWSRQSNYVKIPGTNTHSRPIIFAAGSDLSGFGTTPDSIRATVNNIRSKSPGAAGFVHFAYAGLAASGDLLFKALADPGYPYASPATYPGPSTLVALPSPDTTPPNPPVAAAASASAPGAVVVTFNRPAAAGDGDLPVQYRIYRDTQSPVREYYGNLQMVFWEPTPSRTSFTWTDVRPLTGNTYYKVVAYDDWFNQAATASVGPVASQGEMIIESRAGGQNFAKYTDSGMSDSTAKSSAPGCTPGIGSRYSTNATLTASGTFTPGVSGRFDLYVTVDNASSHNAANTRVEINPGGYVGTVPLVGTNPAVGDAWYLFASNIELTTASTIVFREQAPQADRFNMDAIRLVPATPPTPWETKPLLYNLPPPSLAVGSSVIADDGAGLGGSASTLNLQNYDDVAGATAYGTYTDPSNYGPGGYTRAAQNAGKANKAMWSIDLPVSGKYDLKAYVKNAAYTSTARYQFRAYTDRRLTNRITVNVTTSQANRGLGFTVEADGQANDADSYWFKAGKNYIAVWDDSGNSSFLIADAVRWRLIEPADKFFPEKADPFTTGTIEPPGSTVGWSPFGFNTPGFAYPEYDPVRGAYLGYITPDPSRFRVTGVIANLSEWLPYSAVGASNIVRAKYFVFAGGQSNPSDFNQIPNLRLRCQNRFAVNSMLEVFNHTNDIPAQTALEQELRPSSDATKPSLYRVDFDPVDVPYLVANAATEGIGRAFEAYALYPQDNGFLAMTESIIGTYPASAISAPVLAAKIYRTDATDAGDLKAFNPAAERSIYNVIPSPIEGGFATQDFTPPLATVAEGATGVTIDTGAVSTSRIGIASCEFNPDRNTNDLIRRVRVEPGRQYKVRWHVTSTQQTNRQSQVRLRARAIKFAWSQKLEIGGAWGTGGGLYPLNANNSIAQQALPGIGGANPDRTGSESGGWYTMIVHTPLSPEIRPEFSDGTPITTRMPNISAQAGPGVNAVSRRDLFFGCDVVDTLSGGAGAPLEAGNFTIDRIEVYSYSLVPD
ncbi:MAG: family 10 glycosylhydrolase [Candidatus Sumerlaeaceae bacterium]|nr:family 10 glycosylhydrolase [Candidatus Sumerlaeaceae bacterium]